MTDETYAAILETIRATPATNPANKASCGCGFAWDDTIVTGMTPAPAARCPDEYNHKDEG